MDIPMTKKENDQKNDSQLARDISEVKKQVSEFPENWKTNKNLRFWLSQQSGDIISFPEDLHLHESLVCEFAKQYSEDELVKKNLAIKKLKLEISRLKKKMHDMTFSGKSND